MGIPSRVRTPRHRAKMNPRIHPMQPKQQRALELILAGYSVTDIAAQVGVRRETI